MHKINFACFVFAICHSVLLCSLNTGTVGTEGCITSTYREKAACSKRNKANKGRGRALILHKQIRMIHRADDNDLGHDLQRNLRTTWVKP